MGVMPLARLRPLLLAVLVALCSVALLKGRPAWAQDDRDYMRVIGASEMLVYAAEVATKLSEQAQRKFPQIEQSSGEGARRSFCASLRDSPDMLIAPFGFDQSPEEICGPNESLLALPFGRQVFVLYAAPGGPKFNVTHGQLFRAIVRELPRDIDSDSPEGGFRPNPYQRWSEISPDLPDIPIRVLGPPERTPQWLTMESLLMRPACFEMPAIKALAKVDEATAESHCLSRRGGPVMSFAEGAKYNAKPEIVPKGTELALNERRAMLLTKDMVPLPIDGVEPDSSNLDANRYFLARPLVAVTKVSRLDQIPNLRNFIRELVSARASGPRGYLALGVGMDTLPDTALSKSALRAEFAQASGAGKLRKSAEQK